jgi:hypothetical protein
MIKPCFDSKSAVQPLGVMVGVIGLNAASATENKFLVEDISFVIWYE